MSASSTNYRENLFRHQYLTRIHGEPTFSTLKILARELKANARSVYSNLGGAANGHLGLILSDAQYALISPIPFVRVTYPDPLTIVAGTALLLKQYSDSSVIVLVLVCQEVIDPATAAPIQNERRFLCAF